MPKVKANNITMNYEQQGTGETLILLPFLTADHACYAFQVAEYAKHFTCISLDLRGTGETDKPAGVYSTDFLRTMLPPSCKPRESKKRISPAYPWVRLPVCGWRRSTPTRFGPCPCIAVGRRRTPF